MNPLAKMADTCRQILTEQTISAGGPGTILRDVETLIDFIGERGLTSKARTGNLSAEELPELNARLAGPITLGLKRPLLRDYPNIAGPFVLLRVMDLVRADGKRVWIDADALRTWRGLNPVESYFALLEAWLFRADAGVLGGEDRRNRDQFTANLDFLAMLATTRWKRFEDYCHSINCTGAVSTWNTQLQMRFGLVEVRVRALAESNGKPRQPGRGWTMEQARRTRWGQAVVWALHLSVATEDDEEMWLSPPADDADFGFLQPTFQPFFPAWEKCFATASVGARAGVYIFRVRLDKRRAEGAVWRRLAVPHRVSLDALADAVLQAFEFSDTEHAYEFRYRDERGNGRVYFHPEIEEGPYTDEITVGELGLLEKGVMKFKFDYGANWRFEVELERIDPPGQAKTRITLLETMGEGPAQYEEWS
ncbi:MAG: hypothetical protein EXS37_04545 [Opitutus sp.]|nr:hypothetical protein [Opitutus sp.]